MVPLMNQACDTFMTKLEKVPDHEESVDIHEYGYQTNADMNERMNFFSAD